MLAEFIRKIKSARRLSQLLILVSFLITFGVIRVITFLQKENLLPNQNSPVFHLHHLVPGIFFILISGYLGISFWAQHKIRMLMAILFGIGAALTIDEFALWIYLKDVYWAKEGRASVDATIVVILILSIAFLISEVHDHKWIRRFVNKV